MFGFNVHRAPSIDLIVAFYKLLFNSLLVDMCGEILQLNCKPV